MKKWVVTAVAFFIHAGFQFYRGVDRMENYYMSEDYSSLNTYAYVGNDADNLIINSNITAGHYTIGAISLLIGIMLICTGAIIKAIKTKQEEKALATPAETPVENTVQ